MRIAMLLVLISFLSRSVYAQEILVPGFIKTTKDWVKAGKIISALHRLLQDIEHQSTENKALERKG